MEWKIVGDKMYRLRVKSQFDAAHKLGGNAGKCSRLHGHTWTVEVFVSGKELNQDGMLIDFRELKAKLGELVKEFDHSYLNEFEEIGTPTSENIARYIYNKLKGSWQGVDLEKVRIWEGEKSWCEYYE